MYITNIRQDITIHSIACEIPVVHLNSLPITSHFILLFNLKMSFTPTEICLVYFRLTFTDSLLDQLLPLAVPNPSC